MGNIFARLYCHSKRQINVGMLGLDNAGKTTILYKLLDNLQNQHIIPTLGFNVEAIRFGQYLLNIWDVGGGSRKSRELWRHYNEKTTKAIIFVIDATDTQRLPYAAEALKWLWWKAELSQAVFLIFANKQDLTGRALKGQQIAELLNLRNASKHHNWFVQECCALSGEGVWEGLQKLLQMHDERKAKSRLRLIRH